MRIDANRCTGCGDCLPYCPVSAIVLDAPSVRAEILREECVECEACLRAAVCAAGAIEREALTWPRSLRGFYSNPQTTHGQTLLPGRGTEEMKTNDVTGRIPPGAVSLTIEMGRPVRGATFRDVQQATVACADAGGLFEPNNPLFSLMDDPRKGTFRPDILDEKILSVVVEMTVPEEKLFGLLGALKDVSLRIRTVFSLGLSQVAGADGTLPLLAGLASKGFAVRPNGKTNLGLGRACPATDGAGPKE